MAVTSPLLNLEEGRGFIVQMLAFDDVPTAVVIRRKPMTAVKEELRQFFLVQTPLYPDRTSPIFLSSS